MNSEYIENFFSGEVKEDLLTLYTFIESVKGCVNKFPQDIEKFNNLFDMLRKAYKSESIHDARVINFIDLARRKNFRREWVMYFFESTRSNSTQMSYATFEDLNRYLYGSIEVIGLMVANIMELPQDTYPFARSYSKSVQLLDFIRDIKDDLEIGRIYLPLEDFARFRLDSLDLSIDENKDKVCYLIEFELKRYFELQKEAIKGFDFVPRSYLIPLKTMTDVYNWIAQTIKNDPLIIFEKKVIPSKYIIMSQYIKNKMIV